ncbi:unnamed protein product [Schistocephalus solidus]|uniref:Tektin n=1 Tax=Schistocephalus solidus TaxID=70667 RepID=A0A183SC26_SCHSO|nr:unnamed protein product [Schistocephalus solidus]
MNVAAQLCIVLNENSPKMCCVSRASGNMHKNLKTVLLCLEERISSLESRIQWADHNGNVCRKLSKLSSRIAVVDCALRGLNSERHILRSIPVLKVLETEVNQAADNLEQCIPEDDQFVRNMHLRSFHSWAKDQGTQLSQRLLECRLQLQTDQICLDAIRRVDELCDRCAALQLRLCAFEDDLLFWPTAFSWNSSDQEFKVKKPLFCQTHNLP